MVLEHMEAPSKHPRGKRHTLLLYGFLSLSKVLCGIRDMHDVRPMLVEKEVS